MKARFARWVLLFGAVGLLIPAALVARHFAFGTMFGEWAARLWPSSLMFMALLDTKTSTIVFVYGLALFANILQYALAGLVTWPLAYLVFRLRDRTTSGLKPQ